MLNEFIAENLTMTYDFIKIPANEVYERYLKYCEIRKIEPLGIRIFYNKLERYGFSKCKGTGNVFSFRGVYLKKCLY